MARKRADPRHRVRAAASAGRPRRDRMWCRCISSTGWCAGCCRASCPGLPVGAVAHLCDRGARRAAACRADGPARRLWAGAARLHEEIIPVTAIWTEAERERKTAAATRSKAARNARLTSSRRRCATRARRPSMAVARIQAAGRARHRRSGAGIRADRRANVWRKSESNLPSAARAKRNRCRLLEQQRERIAKADAEFDPNQLLLPGSPTRSAASARPTAAIGKPARAARKRNRATSLSASAPPTMSRPSAGAGRSRLSLAGVRVTHGRRNQARPRSRMARPCPAGRPGRRAVLLKELGLAPVAPDPGRHGARLPRMLDAGYDRSPASAGSLGVLVQRCLAGRRRTSPAPGRPGVAG